MATQGPSGYQQPTSYGQTSSSYAPTGAQSTSAYAVAAPATAYDSYAQAAAVPTRISNGPWVIAGIALFMVLLSMFMSWYSLSISAGFISGSLDFSLFGSCSISAGGMSASCAMMALGGPVANVFSAMAPSLILVVVALLMSVAALGLGITRKTPPRNAGLLLILSGALGIVAPLILIPGIGQAVMAALATMGGSGPVPPGTNIGFMGGIDVPGGGRLGWGPGLGWWLSLVAAAMSIAAGVAARVARPVPIVQAPAAYAAGAFYTAPQQVYAQAGYGSAGAYGATQAQSAAAAPAQQAATKNCPTCGTLNWATSAVCGKCGAPMAR